MYQAAPDSNTAPFKLKHGTLSKIARRFGVSVQHVSLIVKGERPGRPNLMAAIEREIQKQRAA